MQPTTDDMLLTAPHNREAEEAVIGSVLISPYVYQELAQRLRQDSFYIRRLGFIWTAFERLSGRGDAIDILTVADELRDMSRLEEIGGPAFLTSLLNQVPTTLHAETYARTVADFATKRQLLKVFNQGAEFSYNGKDPAHIIETMQAQLSNIAMAAMRDDEIQTGADAMREAMLKAEQASAGNIRNITSGISDLDRHFRMGFQEGKLVLFCGRSGSGKSAMLATIARKAIKDNKHIAFFTMEMGKDEIANRIVSQLTSIPFDRVEAGKIQEHELAIYYQACETVSGANIDFFDEAEYSIPGMKNLLDKSILQGGDYDAVFVDPLNMMDAQMYGAKPYERINELGYGLKKLARKLRTPFLVAHHLNRGAEERNEPELRDLEQAGEKPADIIIFIYSMPDDDIGQRRLKIGKHRGGPVATERAAWLPQFTKFASLYKGQDDE